MSTRRMGLLNIPQEEWLLYPKLVDQDEEIPHCIKHTFMSLHARADDKRTLTIVSKQATKMLSGKSGRTFRDHLKKLRELGLIGTSKTNQGVYVEFYSPWLRYTRIRQKRQQYSVEPNSWIHPRIAQYMHIAGKFPCDLKKLCKEYQSSTDAVEKAMESLAWDVIHRDLAENGYAYIPDKKSPGVYQLVMYKGRGGKLIHDNSYLPKHRDKAVWAVCVATGKKTRITFERSIVEAVEVNSDLTEAVETRDSLDTQAYALGFRMGQNKVLKELHTSAVNVAIEEAKTGSSYQTYSNEYKNGMILTEVGEVFLTQNADVIPHVNAEKLPILLYTDNSNNTIDSNSNNSSLYIFHKEINCNGNRYASLRSCRIPSGEIGGDKEEIETTETETTQEPMDTHFNSGYTQNITKEKRNITETEETTAIDTHFSIVSNTNITETERNFTETDSEGTNSAFSVSSSSNTDNFVGDSVAVEDGSASNTDKVVGDSTTEKGSWLDSLLSEAKNIEKESDGKKPSPTAWLDNLLMEVESFKEECEEQKQKKIIEKEKRAARKARKALRDALASTDIKISNLTSDAEQDKLIADVCSHGLATDPDKVLPAWTVKHPAVRAEEYEASKQRAAELDTETSWVLNIATAKKNAAMTLTEPLESLSWRCTASHTHGDSDRSLNALKRFKAKLNRPLELPQSLKKHYPDCYRDQK